MINFKVLPVMAMIIGVCSAFATKESNKANFTKQSFDDPVYFQYNSTPGHEDGISINTLVVQSPSVVYGYRP